MSSSQRAHSWSLPLAAFAMLFGPACIAGTPDPIGEASARLAEVDRGDATLLDPGTGSGALPGNGSGSGDPGGGDPGGGDSGGGDPGGGDPGGGDPGGGDPGGGGGGGGGGTQVPSVITGAQLTLAYSGHVQYTLPAWNTLPAVQVVEQLMIATYTQPDFNGPVTGYGATIFLRVVGDPFVDTYVFSYREGTPGDPGSFQDPAGNWFVRTGGAPSQAGPPMTGRSELVMAQAESTSWTVLTDWAIPNLYVPDGWPPIGASSVSGLSASKVALSGPSAAMSWEMISLNGAAAVVTGLYGLAALSAFGGGPACAPATAACGTSIVRVATVFVTAYVGMQAAMSGQQALRAAAQAGAAGAALAVWRSQLARDVLAAVITSAGICAASASTCGTEAAHFCGLSQAVPGNAIICAQDTRLTAFNGAGIGAAIGIALTGVLDVGSTIFRNFGIGVAN
ncbi:MAG: hypothetical protein R3B48_03275 [Kofleriaceae bacterium]